MCHWNQDLQEKFCKVEKDCFGAWEQNETFLKIEGLSWKYKQNPQKMKNSK